MTLARGRADTSRESRRDPSVAFGHVGHDDNYAPDETIIPIDRTKIHRELAALSVAAEQLHLKIIYLPAVCDGSQRFPQSGLASRNSQFRKRMTQELAQFESKTTPASIGITDYAGGVGNQNEALSMAQDFARRDRHTSPEIPARFKGMGQNPNTSSLLFAVAAPNAAWMLASTHTIKQRLLWASALTLLAASIVASGSHGALIAAGAGCAVVGFLVLRRRALRVTAIAAVAATVVAGFWIETLPQPSRTQPTAAAAPSPPPSARPGYTDAEINTPLNGELGIPLPGQKNPRTLTSSSGRIEAWRGAIRQAEQRPIAGYGFGTESHVFIDRWWTFTGGVPEDSYIGIALQLGVAGILVFGALLAALSRCAFRSFVRQRRGVVAAGFGVLVAALVAAVGQSYIYSVGDVATTTVWISVFLLAPIRRADA